MNASTALTTSTGSLPAARGADPVALWHQQLALDVKAAQISADTAATYKRGMNHFLAWGREHQHDTGTATRNAVKEWVAELRTNGKSVATIGLWLSSVRAFFQWAISEGLYTVDPTTGVKAGKRTGVNRGHKRDTLTDNEMMRVLSLPDLSKRDKAILHLFAFTAARGIELQRAQLSDLSTRGEFLSLNVQGKGRDEADEFLIVADRDAETALRDWLAQRGTADGALFTARYRGETHALSRRQLRGIVKAAFRRAGVVETKKRPKSTHSLRHTALTAARRGGASLEDTQKLARHASIVTTQIYDHSINRVENAAEKHIRYSA